LGGVLLQKLAAIREAVAASDDDEGSSNGSGSDDDEVKATPTPEAKNVDGPAPAPVAPPPPPAVKASTEGADGILPAPTDGVPPPPASVDGQSFLDLIKLGNFKLRKVEQNAPPPPEGNVKQLGSNTDVMDLLAQAIDNKEAKDKLEAAATRLTGEAAYENRDPDEDDFKDLNNLKANSFETLKEVAEDSAEIKEAKAGRKKELGKAAEVLYEICVECVDGKEPKISDDRMNTVSKFLQKSVDNGKISEAEKEFMEKEIKAKGEEESEW
jgi:hypothetical protein